MQDGRRIFDFERTPEDKIYFIFDANNKLVGVSVYFPQRGILVEPDDGTPSDTEILSKLLQKLRTLFGEHDQQPALHHSWNEYDFGLYAGNVMGTYKWPEDEGVTISVNQFMLAGSSGLFGLKTKTEQTLTFNIGVPSQMDEKVDKKDLGFE
jgi:hypothetical protein